MGRVVDIQSAATFVPNTYVEEHSSYASISGSYPITNAYDSSSSNNYAYITCNTGSGAATYISLKFPITGIPSTATIDSITCKAKLRVSSTSYITTARQKKMRPRHIIQSQYHQLMPQLTQTKVQQDLKVVQVKQSQSHRQTPN